MKKFIPLIITLLFFTGVIIYTSYEYKDYLNTTKEKYANAVIECNNTEDEEKLESCDKIISQNEILQSDKYPGDIYSTYFSFMEKTNFRLIVSISSIILIVLPIAYTRKNKFLYLPVILLLPLLVIIAFIIVNNYSYETNRSLVNLFKYLAIMVIYGIAYYNIGLMVRRSSILFYKTIAMYGTYIVCIIISRIVSWIFKSSIQMGNIYEVNSYESLNNSSSLFLEAFLFVFITLVILYIYKKFNRIKNI